MRSTVDGILGEFNRKAERPEMSTIQRLLDCMQHRRNGSDNTIKAGETVLAYANDQFSGGRDGHGLVISFHGVIDNAAELSTRCGNNENEKYEEAEVKFDHLDIIDHYLWSAICYG